MKAKPWRSRRSRRPRWRWPSTAQSPIADVGVCATRVGVVAVAVLWCVAVGVSVISVAPGQNKRQKQS
jgi:hypothetical protein